MSYEEIVSLIEQIDGSVCAKGITVHLWFLDAHAEFNTMISQVGDYRLHRYGVKDSLDYRDDLYNSLRGLTYNERRDILDKHKKLWLTLIQKSELSNLYFTIDKADLFYRIAPLAWKEVYITLNEYNFIPVALLHEYNANHMIELGSHEILSYTLSWKKELVKRYSVVNRMRRMYMKRCYMTDTLAWTIDAKQVRQLVTLFRTYFKSGTSIDLIVDILRCKNDGNIIWVASTEALVHFFRSLLKHKLIKSQKWGNVISNRLMIVNKRGTIITNKSINTSAYHLDSKESSKPPKAEFLRIDSQMAYFMKIV